MSLFKSQNNKFSLRFIAILSIFLILIVFPFIIKHQYIIHIMIMIFIFAILAQAWNILSGYAGQISLGNAMFFGLGAYTSTILLVKFSINPWIGMIVGGLIAVIFAFFLGLPLFRLRKQYFVIATLAAAEILRITFNNWEYANGARGLDLPFIPDSFINMSFTYNKNGFYFISLIILSFLIFLVFIITKTKLGYYFKTLKGEEDAARSIGINVLAYKLVAISITAFFTAVAGTIYSQYLLYIDPSMVYPITLSIKIIMIAALGGASTVIGPVLGAFLLIPLTEITRITFGGGGQGFDLLLYSTIIIFIALYKPDGLITIFGKSKIRFSDKRNLDNRKDGNINDGDIES